MDIRTRLKIDTFENVKRNEIGPKHKISGQTALGIFVMIWRDAFISNKNIQ